ncbi:MAG: prefoldin subunit alpha [Nitrososphaerota archaeon]|nr:prefoldin subunit alpha [Nitrososphaerota archaeon]
MSNKEQDEAIQSAVLQNRMLEEYYADLQLRENFLARILAENKASIQSLESLDETKEMELAVPVGAGAYLFVQYSGARKVLLNVGSGVVMEKPKSEAITFIEARVREIEQALREVLRQKNEVGNRLSVLRDQLETGYRQQG